MTGVKIPFVLDMREGEVSRVVDLLGGLELFVANPVNLARAAEPAGGPQGPGRVLLPSGSVNLDGDKLVDFISYEDELEPEIDQVGRKQKFLQALLQGMGERSGLLLQESPFRTLRANMSTNLNSRALTAFIREMEKLEAERVIFNRVLGSVRPVDGKELLFPHSEGDLLKETLRQSLETIASSEALREDPLDVSVQILNGTDVAGLARRGANVFQSFGYDVAQVSNADRIDYARTLLIDRKGMPELARKAAELIHCERVVTQVDATLDPAIDITVILGKDFDGRYCKK